MTYNNFSIKFSKGVFYQTAKVPTEGFTINTYTDRESKTEKTNYHKECDTVYGKLHSITLKEAPFGGEQICISLTDKDGNANVLQMNVFSGGTNVDDYAKSLAQYLENLVLGAETEISLNKTQKNKEGKLFKNMSIKQDGQKVDWAFKLFGTDSIVPRGVEVTNPVTKKKAWNFDEHNAFLYEKIRTATNNVNATGTASEATSTNSDSETSASEDGAPLSDNVDDLPF